ncbi:MAG: hypothetical protein WCG02_01350 [Candidatus Taylorbacteria bacterium]
MYILIESCLIMIGLCIIVSGAFHDMVTLGESRVFTWSVAGGGALVSGIGMFSLIGIIDDDVAAVLFCYLLVILVVYGIFKYCKSVDITKRKG